MKIDAHILLDAESLQLKAQRIAMELIEHYSHTEHLVFIGINTRGHQFAHILAHNIQAVLNLPIQIAQAEIDAQDVKCMLNTPITSATDIVIIDDVMNSGRTVFNLINSLHLQNVKSVRVAVTVDREHKRFPIHADFVGIALSTSLHDYVEILFESGQMVKAVNVQSIV